MINVFFAHESDNVNMDDLYFQQGGATTQTLGERIISRLGAVAWPPKLWDLRSLDYFLLVILYKVVRQRR